MWFSESSMAGCPNPRFRVWTGAFLDMTCGVWFVRGVETLDKHDMENHIVSLEGLYLTPILWEIRVHFLFFYFYFNR